MRRKQTEKRVRSLCSETARATTQHSIYKIGKIANIIKQCRRFVLHLVALSITPQTCKQPDLGPTLKWLRPFAFTTSFISSLQWHSNRALVCHGLSDWLDVSEDFNGHRSKKLIRATVTTKGSRKGAGRFPHTGIPPMGSA